MRRAPFVLGGTAGGLALLLSYHTTALSITVSQASRAGTVGTKPAAGAPPSPAGAGGQAGQESPPAAPGSSTTIAAPGGTAAGAGSAPSGSSSSGVSASTVPPAGPAATAPPPAPTTTVGTQTFTGKQVSYQYGVLEVQITAQGGHIVAVSEPVDNGNDAHSVDINNRAIPQLNQEALQAQSANIQAVSGATYTSNAYIQSLQSAIDQMG